MQPREYDFTKKFTKSLKKLKGKELQNVLKKIEQIISVKDLSHYKNLKFDLSKY